MISNYLQRRTVRMTAASLASAALLTGCASFSPDGGMNKVATTTSEAIAVPVYKITSEADETATRRGVDAMLTKTLSAETAVQLALMNNRGLQAEFNALGISEADFVASTQLSNPVVSFGKLLTGSELEIETRLAFSVLELFTLESRSGIAKLEFEAAQFRAVQATFRLAAETRRAFYTAVAARQMVGFLEKGAANAQVAVNLTLKLGETGAATKVEQARASAFYLEVANQLAEARLQAEVDREALTRLLGLWGSSANYRLPGVLPPIPDRIPKSGDVEADAIRKRVDLIIAKLELDALAKSLGLTNATRYTSMVDLAGLANYRRDGDGAETVVTRGYEIELEVPLFDTGEAEVRKAHESYMQAVNRLAELAINIRSEVRSAYVAYRAKYDISWQFRNRILPMREIISEEALLQYNGMLTDVFDLLTTAAESVDSNVAAIVAKRDFFLASVDFQAALIGGGAGTSSSSEMPAATAAAAGGH